MCEGSSWTLPLILQIRKLFPAKWTPVRVVQQTYPYQTNLQHRHYLWKHEPHPNEHITCGNIHLSITMITATNFIMLSTWQTWSLYELWIEIHIPLNCCRSDCRAWRNNYMWKHLHACNHDKHYDIVMICQSDIYEHSAVHRELLSH